MASFYNNPESVAAKDNKQKTIINGVSYDGRNEAEVHYIIWNKYEDF